MARKAGPFKATNFMGTEAMNSPQAGYVWLQDGGQKSKAIDLRPSDLGAKWINMGYTTSVGNFNWKHDYK
jgi:hypothetical protein